MLEAQNLRVMNNVNRGASETTELWDKKDFVIVTNYFKSLHFSDFNSAHGATFILSI